MTANCRLSLSQITALHITALSLLVTLGQLSSYVAKVAEVKVLETSLV